MAKKLELWVNSVEIKINSREKAEQEVEKLVNKGYSLIQAPYCECFQGEHYFDILNGCWRREKEDVWRASVGTKVYEGPCKLR